LVTVINNDLLKILKGKPKENIETIRSFKDRGKIIKENAIKQKIITEKMDSVLIFCYFSFLFFSFCFNILKIFFSSIRL